VTRHKTPWILVGEQAPAFDDDRWELYDTTTDWSQARDLSKEHPDRLRELQRLWLIEAVKYNVLPLDDRVGERLNPDLAGRPTLIKGNSQLLFGGMGWLSESSVVNFKNKSHAVTAEVVVPASGAEGVIIAPGREHRRLEPVRQGRAAQVLLQPVRRPALLRRGHPGHRRGPASGADGVRLRRRRAREGRRRPAVRGRGEGRRGPGGGDRAMVFSADDTCDVGVEGGAVVSEDYGPRGNEFTGEVNWVQIDLDEAAADLDHLITPEERLRIAMARQ